MQTIRRKLTRLRKSIEEKLPDGEDIFGYPGISKNMLAECVDDAYNLSYKLDEMEPKFEITVLKRKISGLLESCKDYLSRDVDLWGKEKKFNKFISDLTKIREEIRLTYLIVVDKGLRTEIEAQQILSDYNFMSEYFEKYKGEFDIVQEKFDELSVSYEKINSYEEESTEIHSKLIDAQNKINTIQNESQSSFEFTSKYESEAKERMQNIIEVESHLRSIDNQAEALNEKTEHTHEEIEALKDDLQAQISLNKKQQDEIQNTG